MKNFKISFITAIFTFFAFTSGVFAFYNDVPDDHEYYESIKALYNSDLLKKNGSNLFFPDKSLTQSDLYEMILTFAQVDLATDINLPFINTSNTANYAPYLQTAINSKILKNIGINKEFKLQKTVSKAEALKVMFDSLGIGVNNLFDRDNFYFVDLDKNSSTAALAQKAYEIGVFENKNPKLFKKAKRITKAEAADYLYKISEYKPEAELTIVYDYGSFSDGYTSMESELLDASEFDDLLDVWNNLHTTYYYKDELKDGDLIFGAIKGMVNETSDNYTIFEKPEDADDLLDNLSSSYEGIGVSLEMIDDELTIISPFKDSPGEKAGLKPNDVIIAVNGEDIYDLTTGEIINKIKGPAGTDVELTILRDKKELDFTLTRESITLQTVYYDLMDEGNKNIVYIELISFNEDTYKEFLEAAEEILEENPDGIIVDVRNNPGGYMDVAVAIISLFTDEEKTAVKLEFGDGDIEEYKTTGSGLLKDFETVVLINEGSASAAEIFAGALQDFEIAKVFGQTSFGKGTVQELREYRDGSLFKFTTAKWLTPNGTEIDQKGITPDRKIENSEKTDWQLDSALEEF